MRWATAISHHGSLAIAAGECITAIEEQLRGGEVGLVLAFVSPQHRDHWQALPSILSGSFPRAVRLGCSAGGTIASGVEIERGASLSLAAASLPGVTITPFLLAAGEEPEPQHAGRFWSELLGCHEGDTVSTILLPDPFTARPEVLADGLDRVFPAGTTIGGLVSGGRRRGRHLLLLEDTCQYEGTVGVALRGALTVRSLVSQGCRPVGNPMFVTGCSGPLILELDGQPPAEVLQELVVSGLDKGEELLQDTLFIGTVMQDDKVEYGGGDFLIRSIIGFEPSSGALAVTADTKVGQVVQFHIRDGAFAAQELTRLLRRDAASQPTMPDGALLFSCVGRGSDLYGRPNNDSLAFLDHRGPVPLAGFFCNGEIGPVGNRTFLHAFSSVFALFWG